METRRLKNIAILILLLLNIFLILLLGYQHLQSQRSHALAVEQLHQLFAADQIPLSPQADLAGQPLQPMSLTRNTEAEQTIAAYLLGSEPTLTDQNGSIHSYTGSSGSIHFRSGGSFDSSELSLPVANVIGFAQDFFRTFGYVQTDEQLSGSSGTVTALRYVDGVPVADCSVSLRFTDGALTAVSGTYISLEDAVAAEGSEQLSCITALIRFLDHRRDSGMISRQVNDIFCIYKLDSTSSVLHLLPIWQIETDTYTYLVDCGDGEINLES